MIPIVGEGGEHDPARIQLATRKGTPVPNVRKMQLPPQVVIALATDLLKNHPTLKIRSLSSVYNCVGMVFASRRTVVDTNHVPTFLDEDGYRKIAEEDVCVGDVVIYKDGGGNITHIGIIVTRSPDLERGLWKLEVLSQWGEGGEYFHAPRDVPLLYGATREFWTERV